VSSFQRYGNTEAPRERATSTAVEKGQNVNNNGGIAIGLKSQQSLQPPLAPQIVLGLIEMHPWSLPEVPCWEPPSALNAVTARLFVDKGKKNGVVGKWRSNRER
jgi:hypothetical protein